jgi:hypothetical protein
MLKLVFDLEELHDIVSITFLTLRDELSGALKIWNNKSPCFFKF